MRNTAASRQALRAPEAAVPRIYASAREPEKDQDQPLDVPRYGSGNAANSSEPETRQPKIPSEQGIFRDLTGKFVEGKSGIADRFAGVAIIAMFCFQWRSGRARDLRDIGSLSVLVNCR